MKRPSFAGKRRSPGCRAIKLSKVSYGKNASVKITKARVGLERDRLRGLLLLTAPKLLRKRRLVEFQFYHSTARSVCVAGTFDEAPTRSIPMEHLGGGAWVARLILPDGRYDYYFLVDGERRPDPLATEFRVGPFGEMSSVLVVD